jgi:hypothetical protein
MSKEIKTMEQANKRLSELGQKRHVFKSLKQAQITVEQAEKRASAKTSAVSAPTAKPANARESLLSAIEAEKQPGAKADLYEKLSQSLLSDIKQESDPVKKTELTRAYQRSEKNRGYCLHAEASLDPKAAQARKFLRMLE